MFSAYKLPLQQTKTINGWFWQSQIEHNRVSKPGCWVSMIVMKYSFSNFLCQEFSALVATCPWNTVRRGAQTKISINLVATSPATPNMNSNRTEPSRNADQQGSGRKQNRDVSRGALAPPRLVFFEWKQTTNWGESSHEPGCSKTLAMLDRELAPRWSAISLLLSCFCCNWSTNVNYTEHHTAGKCNTWLWLMCCWNGYLWLMCCWNGSLFAQAGLPRRNISLLPTWCPATFTNNCNSSPKRMYDWSAGFELRVGMAVIITASKAEDIGLIFNPPNLT